MLHTKFQAAEPSSSGEKDLKYILLANLRLLGRAISNPETFI